MTIPADILAILESSRLPLTLSDIAQDVAVMPIARGEPMRIVNVKEVAEEVNRLVRGGKVQSGLTDGGSELVYRIKVERGLTQRSLL